MTGPIIAVAAMLAGLGVWVFGTRPYLQRHGGAVATGATLWVGEWADWQQCRDFARVNRDWRALRRSNIFMFTQLGIVVGIILTLWRT